MGVAEQLQARLIDPRDTRWEASHPSYRVVFWSQSQHNGHSAPMWVAEEWAIDNADIDQILAWAADHAQARTTVVYAFITCAEGPGLVRLLGTDPTAC